MRCARFATLVLVASAFVGCDGGPAGPGTLTVEVSAPVQIGAVQIQVTGEGITAVNGLGGSEVASRVLPGGQPSEESWSIVAFAPNGGPIRIGVDVQSTDAVLQAVALDAAGLDGNRTGVAGVDVRVVR
jgi:hypothetical protein